MPVLDLTAALGHLRLEDDYPAEQVEPKLWAAVEMAEQFLNRKLYGTEAERLEAQTGIDAELSAARAAFDTAYVTYRAEQMFDGRPSVADNAYEGAQRAYRRALSRADEIRDGMVATPMIKAAILLILGHLFENRQDVIADARATPVTLPQGSAALLQPYRVGMGV